MAVPQKILMVNTQHNKYNNSMKNSAILSLLVLFFVIGCESADTERQSHYDKISEQIEQLKAQSEAQANQHDGSGDNIRVTIKLLTTSKSDYFAIDALWEYVNRNFVVRKRPEIFVDSGIKIGTAVGDFKARLDVAKQQLKSSEETEMFLVLANGSSGYINMGTEISVPRFYYFDRYYKSVDYQFRQAGKSFKVTVQKIPDRNLINLKLTPVFSNFLNDGGDLELTELLTNITIRPNQPVVIGGSTGEQLDAGRGLCQTNAS